MQWHHLRPLTQPRVSAELAELETGGEVAQHPGEELGEGGKLPAVPAGTEGGREGKGRKSWGSPGKTMCFPCGTVQKCAVWLLQLSGDMVYHGPLICHLGQGTVRN